MKKLLLIAAVVILFSGFSCKNNFNLPEQNSNGIFVYHYSGSDTSMINDINKIMENNYRRICDDLDYKYNYRVEVYIYPDQKTYDENLTDKAVVGTPACSGNRRMQIVSPASPINIPGIPYTERLLMPVHEFVHLMLDEINNNLPVWIDEGLASYEGSSNLYEYFCKKYLPQMPSINFNDLEKHYYNIPGADVYAYSAVRFIKENYGLGKLNSFIRSPEDLTEIFSVTKGQFSKEWNDFITKNYRN